MKNKKILFLGLMATFIMISISMSSAVSTQTKEKFVKIDSPLYKIRTEKATQEKTALLKQNIQIFIKNIFCNRMFLSFPFYKMNDRTTPQTYVKWYASFCGDTSNCVSYNPTSCN